MQLTIYPYLVQKLKTLGVILYSPIHGVVLR